MYIHIGEPIRIYVKELYNENNSSYVTNNRVYRVRKRDLHMIFIELEKAHDKVQGEVLCWTRTKTVVPKKYINI